MPSSTASVGNEYGSESMITAAPEPISGIPSSTPTSSCAVHGGVKRPRLAALERRGPHRHPGPAFQLAAAAEHPAGAAAHQRGGRELGVDGGERRLGIGQMSAAGEHQHEVGLGAAQPLRGGPRRLGRARAGVVCVGEPGPRPSSRSPCTRGHCCTILRPWPPPR